MTASEDMSTPVTRGELREELRQFEARFDLKLDERLGALEARIDHKLDERLGALEARFDHKLEMWGGALLARMESFEARMQSSETRMLTELARHTKAIQESLSTQIAVVDEKYTDLPGRVNRLEGAVFRKKRRDPE